MISVERLTPAAAWVYTKSEYGFYILITRPLRELRYTEVKQKEEQPYGRKDKK